MKLRSFRIRGYKSIIDTGEIVLSENDNISVFVGQNEAGKSSLLEALQAFENADFNDDSIPFKVPADNTQSISCKYSVDADTDFVNNLENEIKEEFKLTITEGVSIFERNKLQKIREFTLIRERKIGEAPVLKIDDVSFQIIKNASLKAPNPVTESVGGADQAPVSPANLIEVADGDNGRIAEAFWSLCPAIIFFNDVNTILPDKISIDDLTNKKTEALGYKAVKNFETLTHTDIVELAKLPKAKRDSQQDTTNETISIDFQKSWRQRIYGENKVNVKFSFEREGESSSMFIYFYVETKDKEFLEPRKRSKGLIWFLSAWMELKAKESEDNKVILYDEPGLYLHIKAHQDVLVLFNHLSSKNGGNHQILYTTHSPSLIDTDYLNRINLVINSEKNGTIVEGVTTSKINTDNKMDALQPISEAMGLQPFKDFGILKIRNVLVEGLSDFWYLKAFKRLLGIDEDYEFIPGVGIKDGKINHLISFCIGYGLSWKLIMDDGHNSLETYKEIKEKVFNGIDEQANESIKILEDIHGIENMLTTADLKLIDSTFSAKEDENKSTKVGKRRKIIFSKTFYEKVISGEITLDKIDKKTAARFQEVFKFIKFI